MISMRSAHHTVSMRWMSASLFPGESEGLFGGSVFSRQRVAGETGRIVDDAGGAEDRVSRKGLTAAGTRAAGDCGHRFAIKINAFRQVFNDDAGHGCLLGIDSVKD